jgi:hypothetical protein
LYHLFKLETERAPWGTDNLLVCGKIFSHLEDVLSSLDINRMARALVLQFIAGYSCVLSTITLDLDHTDNATYKQYSD